MRRSVLQILGCASILGLAVIPSTQSQELVYKTNIPADHADIQYFQRPTHNPLTKLVEQLEAGTLKLEAQDGPLGFLPDLLKKLNIATDTQMMVFSKTSFQAPKISPDNPRAIYFNDEVAVGYVRNSPNIEVAALDPTLGPVFYELGVD